MKKLIPAGIILIAALTISAYCVFSPANTPVPPRSALAASFAAPAPPSSEGIPGYQDERLSAGKILVATEKLRDPHFARTVVLLISYSSRGAAGLIINRPTNAKLSHILPHVKGVRQVTDPLYSGGPVGRNLLTMIIQSQEKPDASNKVFGDIYISNSPSVLEQMIGQPKPDQRFRLYAGYAGWSPGQLDAEIARHDWRILNGTPGLLFDRAPDKIWENLIPQGITI